MDFYNLTVSHAKANLDVYLSYQIWFLTLTVAENRLNMCDFTIWVNPITPISLFLS